MRREIDYLRTALRDAQLRTVTFYNNAQVTAEKTGETIMSHDTYHFQAPVQLTGNLGSGGHTTTNGPVRQVQRDAAGGEELRRIASELAQLREVLALGPRTEPELAAVEQVRLAEQAARSGDESGLRNHLSAAGRWALEMAERIGAEAAAAVLRQSLGA